MSTNENGPHQQSTIDLGHNGRKMPVMGFGTGVYPPVPSAQIKAAVIRAIEVGYRHFDTAHRYESEEPIGEAIKEALSLGLIKSRDELFITSKLWCGHAHPHLVLPALKKTLRNLKMERIDLYLIHWPLSCTEDKYDFPIKEDDFLPLDFKGVWEAMEKCHKLGLANSIGVSNFSCKKLQYVLGFAKIPPAVNQVEVNPFWQQSKLIELCKANGVLVTAYSPLGSLGTVHGSNKIIESSVLQQIAKSKGKSIPQVCLRWAYEQGIAFVVKSYNEERMKENLAIFDWKLSEEDLENIRGIPQTRGATGWFNLCKNGPFKTLEELWDGEI
ncbi:hypothetical protein RND81_02G231100 [Saponaria officinalis]|uniref:NADP-dependent oxidoreductase domain-containing protein n=1 Tax=Saponaria officinalis TaxID=3572 RepID=A0AAW1MZ05_SAPOF